MAKNDESKIYTGGFLLKNILKEMQYKIEGKLPKERKMYLYSGHEINVVFLQILLDVYQKKTPPCGTHVILELHIINEEYFVKVSYLFDVLLRTFLELF